MSAATRVAHAAETIRARWEQQVDESPQMEAAQALEDTCQLLDPEVAAELERLRRYIVTRQAREEELLATLGRIDLRRSPEAWSLGMTFISHMDGPFYPCTAEELEPGLRALVEQLRACIGELEAERHTTNEALSDAAEQLRADRDRIAELEAAPKTVFRASHDSIVMGRYTTAAAAREHCETVLRREMPDNSLDWIEDEEDGVAELTVWIGGEETTTGYVVTPVEVASAYDPDADE